MNDNATRQRSLPRWAIAICVLLAGAASVVSISVWRSTRARQAISLVDSSGKERVRIVASDEGGKIELVDRDGSARASIRQSGDKISIELSAQPPHSHAMRLVVSEKAESLTLMQDDGGHSRLNLGATSDGGGLTVFGERGSLWLQTTSVDSALRLYFGTRASKLEVDTRANAVELDDGDKTFFSAQQLGQHSSLELISPNGKRRIELDASDDWNASVSVDGRKL